MATVRLRQVGGSLSFSVPPTIREALDLSAGTVLDVEVRDGTLVARAARPKYTIDALIAQCDLEAPYPDEAREWLDAPAVGRELL
jgi:antitoxin ChpS